MKLQEIEAFLAVCQYGTFVRAAEHCYTTQPNISWQISSLEKELGTTLFIRGKGIRKLEMTESAKIFLPQAKKFAALWKETEQLLSDEKSDHYRFGCTITIADILFPNVLSMFQEKFPNCHLSETSQYSFNICSLVTGQELDSGVVASVKNFDELKTTPIAREEMVFVCRNDSPYEGEQQTDNLDHSRQVYITFAGEGEDWKDFSQTSSRKQTYFSASVVTDPVPYFNRKDIWAVLPMSYFILKFPQDRFHTCPINMRNACRIFYFIHRASSNSSYDNAVIREIRNSFLDFGGFELLF